MKKYGAKEHILKITNDIIKKKGYINTNIKDVAILANVSVGTLYYHFPRGKIDILIGIMKSIAQEFIEESERIGYYSDKEFFKIEDALKYYLSLTINLHKKFRLTLAAWESEILANLDYYIKLRDELNLTEEFHEEMDLFKNLIINVVNKFPNENLIFNGKENQLYFITQAIIHNYAYDDHAFNSEDEFIDVVSNIILTILRTKN